MKLRYQFEYMKIDDKYCAVPVGENSGEYGCIIKLSEDAKEMMETVGNSDTPNEVLDRLSANHPEEDKGELANQLCEFLNLLIEKGVLDPNA